MSEPEGACRKQKPNATALWPDRYAVIRGRALHFYGKSRDKEAGDAPRGSSIADVSGQ
jgi:hypothetical protein